jgi:uncharacterized protein
MNSKKLMQGIAAVFVLAIFLGGTLALFSQGSYADVLPEETNKETRTISVTGNSIVSVAPNQVEVYFSIESDAVKALKSQQDNAELTAKVKKALMDAGIKENEIKTTGYSLNERYEWSETLRKSQKIGYRTTHSMKVTVKDTSKAGAIIDAAVLGGATSVSSVNFTVDEETRAELTLQALELASKKTMEKAETIAKGVGVTINQLESAVEGTSYYTPVRNYAVMDAKAEYDMGSVPTEFSVGDIEINATVSAVYSIK